MILLRYPICKSEGKGESEFGRENVKLYLVGHEYRYAVEQMLLTLYPEERPEYPDGVPEGERMEIRLHRDVQGTIAGCAFYRGGPHFGFDRADSSRMTDPLTTERIEQRLIKNAMYRAALYAGHEKPVWGALTGVRPGKLLTPLLKSGISEEEALREFIDSYDVSPRRATLCLDAARHTLAAETALGEKDVCLYIGIPFCPTRCAYCSFVSQSVEKSMKLIPPFLDALEKEIEATGKQVRSLGLRPVSLYFGGGTPTTLSAEQALPKAGGKLRSLVPP